PPQRSFSRLPTAAHDLSVRTFLEPSFLAPRLHRPSPWLHRCTLPIGRKQPCPGKDLACPKLPFLRKGSRCGTAAWPVVDYQVPTVLRPTSARKFFVPW